MSYNEDCIAHSVATKEPFLCYMFVCRLKYNSNDDIYEKDSKRRFSTPAGALMYFISEGWEMYLNGATSQGAVAAGYGASSTSSYWILRKPCTKEEFDKAVKDAIKK